MRLRVSASKRVTQRPIRQPEPIGREVRFLALLQYGGEPLRSETTEKRPGFKRRRSASGRQPARQKTQLQRKWA